MTGGPQVVPLLRLRWRMVRSSSARVGLVLALLSVPTLMLLAIAVGALAPRAADVSGLVLVIPSLLLGFFVLSIIAPLGAGGGVELYPSEQLVAYPMRPRTIYVGALLMSPLNLAWLLQVLVALGLLTYVSTGPTHGRLATTFAVMVYLAAVSVVGQAIAWAIIGIRRTAAGRTATWIALGALVVGALLAVATDRWAAILDRAPTVWVVVGALAGSNDRWGVWASRTMIIAAVGVAAVIAGMAACSWALRRPGDGGAVREDKPVSRRRTGRSVTRTFLALDLVGIWRAPALRRGALLLGLLPGLAVAIARADWTVLVLIPSLVGAGAALMFGINAFCLDASGALWLASSPIAARTHFWIRTVTVAVSVSVPIVIALTAGLSRAAPAPSGAWIAAVLGGAVACVFRITATSLRWSVNSPYRADLRGPRDTPAPPGAMAVYALRLSLAATGIGMVMTLLAVLDEVLLPVIGMITIVLFALRSLVSSASLYSDPGRRAHIAQAVSGG